MRRLLIVGILLWVACGDKQKPGVGRNNSDNNGPSNLGEDDFGGSIFPDVTVNDSDNVNSNSSDAGPDTNPPGDTGADPDMDVVDMPADMAPNCPRMNVALGGDCRCNQECASGVCSDASVTEDGFCTLSCESRSDCPSGETCVTDRFGTSVCRTDDTGVSCTENQQAAPSVCSSGHCLQAGSNFPIDYFCSVPCDSAMDCKLGHACVPVRCQFSIGVGYRCLPTVIASRSPNKAQVLATFPESEKLCVAVGAPNPCDAVTMASDEQACPGSMCDASPVGRCTAQCAATTDCPSGGCVDYDVSDGNLPIRVCDL